MPALRSTPASPATLVPSPRPCHTKPACSCAPVPPSHTTLTVGPRASRASRAAARSSPRSRRGTTRGTLTPAATCCRRRPYSRIFAAVTASAPVTARQTASTRCLRCRPRPASTPTCSPAYYHTLACSLVRLLFLFILMPPLELHPLGFVQLEELSICQLFVFNFIVKHFQNSHFLVSEIRDRMWRNCCRARPYSRDRDGCSSTSASLDPLQHQLVQLQPQDVLQIAFDALRTGSLCLCYLSVSAREVGIGSGSSAATD